MQPGQQPSNLPTCSNAGIAHLWRASWPFLPRLPYKSQPTRADQLLRSTDATPGTWPWLRTAGLCSQDGVPPTEPSTTPTDNQRHGRATKESRPIDFRSAGSSLIPTLLLRRSQLGNVEIMNRIYLSPVAAKRTALDSSTGAP